MLSTIRSQVLTAFLVVAAVTLAGSFVALVGLHRLTAHLEDTTERSWPTADMSMEFWIGSLAKHLAAHRYAEGDVEAARQELAWARSFVVHSLEHLQAAGKMAPGTLQRLEELNRECDEALEIYLRAADAKRALSLEAGEAGKGGGTAKRSASEILAVVESRRQDRMKASAELDAAVERLAAVVAPIEEATDLAMDRAAGEGLALAARTRAVVLGIAGVSVALAIFLGCALTLWIVRPLHRLSEATARIGEGKLGERVGIHRKDEIGQLAARFDRMAEDLSVSRDQIVASQARYQSLFEYARDALVVLDANGGIVEANAAFVRMVGRRREGLRRRPFQEFIPEEGREAFLDRLAELLGRGSPLAQMEILGTDGSRIPAEAAAVWLPDGRTVMSLRDVSGRLRLEQALVQGEKLSAIGQLAAGVAHELRNPLFVISNVLYELRETLDSQDPEVADHLRMAADENRRAHEIIDNLLEFARPGGEGTCVIEVDPEIQHVLKVFRESLAQRGIELLTDLRADVRCRFHPDAFKQVMVNLLTNAIDAMPEGGRLGIATRARSDGRVEIDVEDTGVGIPSRRQKEIFNPFFSTKPPGQGTGLGLWIVHATVLRYQGRVSVRSVEGRGSTFSLDLSAAGSAAS